jgi:hypothetical protein
VASEFCSYYEESPTVPAQLRSLMFRLGITKAPEYNVKSDEDINTLVTIIHSVEG